MLILLFLFASLVGCSPKVVYVPQAHTEYVTQYRTDSVIQHDSVYVREQVKGDTIRLTEYRYRYIYKDRVQKDTIQKTDTITIERERVVEKVQYRTPDIVKFLAIVGVAALVLLIVCIFRK